MTELDAADVARFTSLISEAYGYDFSQYAMASLKRRIAGVIKREGLPDLEALMERAATSSEFFSRILDNLTVTVTEMFRDPPVFKHLRDEVFPYLQTYSELKIWHAGCATGEEVYSNAILLTEAGLYQRSIIYGTDINVRALARSRDGILKQEALAKATSDYLEAGGRLSFSRYYTAQYNAAILDSSLKKNIVFSDHNLVTDSKFGEMNLIMCRNTLIYFSPELQMRVLRLFWESLANGGFLCLGSKERLDCSRDLAGCHQYSKTYRIYQKRA